MKYLAVFFVVMPILEMAVLIKVGGLIGVIPTIFAVILTATLGLALLRAQGLSTLLSARQKLQGGELPIKEIAEGICLAVGGALLLTPGFITDVIGFACLIPGPRLLLLQRLVAVLKPRVYTSPMPRESSNSTIEGEFRREQD